MLFLRILDLERTFDSASDKELDLLRFFPYNRKIYLIKLLLSFRVFNTALVALNLKDIAW